MALFRRNNNEPPTPEPPPIVPLSLGRSKKDRPTPSRREAEAARKQRVNRTLTKKEARQESTRQARGQRLRSMSVRESVPEKVLLRDYIDARRSVGEFLLPSLVVILALTALAGRSTFVAAVSSALMYAFILSVLFDCAVMWRGFKRVLAARLPQASTRGLLMYGVNRCIQIRRFRMPPPRISRGEAY